MPAAFVTAFGNPRHAVRLAERPRVAPLAQEVEVAISLAAVNPSDLIPVTGAYSARTTLPFVPGFEGVGTVTRTGENVTGLKAGDRVLPLGAAGLWQSHLVRPADWCFAVPPDLSDEEAATAYINPLTAFRLIDALAAAGSLPGCRIGVTAAGSQIGRMLLSLLTADGAQPIAIVRSKATAEALAADFRDLPIIRSGEGPGMLDGVLDAVGGPAGETLLVQALKPGGRFIQYGALSGIPIDPQSIAARPDASFAFLRLRDWVHSAGRQALAEALERSFSGIRAGDLRSAIAAVYPLAEIAKALAHQDRPGRAGKILLAP